MANIGIAEEVEITREVINERTFAINICNDFIAYGGKVGKAYEKAKCAVACATTVYEINCIMAKARNAM